MKAIVLEIKNGEAAVLREDGIVVTTRQKCRVGDTIEVDEREKIGGVRRFNRIARLAVACMLVICIAGGSLGYMTASASSYVSVDAGDTSLEFGVNRFGRVISVEGLDENSEEFAQTIAKEVKNKKFDDAVTHTKARMEEMGRMDETEPQPVVAGVSGGSEQQKTQLQESLQTTFEHKEGKGPKLYMMDVTPQERQEAISRKQSPGMFAFQRRDDWSEEDWEDFYEEFEDKFDWDDWDEEVRPMPPHGHMGPQGEPPVGEPPMGPPPAGFGPPPQEFDDADDLAPGDEPEDRPDLPDDSDDDRPELPDTSDDSDDPDDDLNDQP